MDKFKFVLTSEPHIKAQKYCSSKEDFHLDNEEDVKNLSLALEIVDLRRTARDQWIHQHFNELDFCYEEVVDIGSQWVDKLRIYAKDDGEELFTLYFGTTEEYEKYMREITSSDKSLSKV